MKYNLFGTKFFGGEYEIIYIVDRCIVLHWDYYPSI